MPVVIRAEGLSRVVIGVADWGMNVILAGWHEAISGFY